MKNYIILNFVIAIFAILITTPALAYPGHHGPPARAVKPPTQQIQRNIQRTIQKRQQLNAAKKNRLGTAAPETVEDIREGQRAEYAELNKQFKLDYDKLVADLGAENSIRYEKIERIHKIDGRRGNDSEVTALYGEVRIIEDKFRADVDKLKAEFAKDVKAINAKWKLARDNLNKRAANAGSASADANKDEPKPTQPKTVEVVKVVPEEKEVAANTPPAPKEPATEAPESKEVVKNIPSPTVKEVMPDLSSNNGSGNPSHGRLPPILGQIEPTINGSENPSHGRLPPILGQTEPTIKEVAPSMPSQETPSNNEWTDEKEKKLQDLIQSIEDSKRQMEADDRAEYREELEIRTEYNEAIAKIRNDNTNLIFNNPASVFVINHGGDVITLAKVVVVGAACGGAQAAVLCAPTLGAYSTWGQADDVASGLGEGMAEYQKSGDNYRAMSTAVATTVSNTLTGKLSDNPVGSDAIKYIASGVRGEVNKAFVSGVDPNSRVISSEGAK